MKKNWIKFWGVRGSLPSPGPETARYGGNTPCIEISYKDTLIICDAGTGIRPLGIDLARRIKGKISATILFSHPHLDHLIGLPFFEPLYKKGNKFTVITPQRSAAEIKTLLKGIIAPPYFPVDITKSAATIKFKGLSIRPISIGEIKIEAFKCNHPGNSYAFKFSFPNGKTLVYTSDNEPSNIRFKQLLKWIKGADVLIHDSQYSPQQYKKKKGWGHSPYHYPISLAAAAHVKKLFLFHYDPETTDATLDKVEIAVQNFVRCMGFDVKVALSREGMKITL